jgi:hypothetical protein
MCWCTPEKRTPICDACPPEKKAGWPQYRPEQIGGFLEIVDYVVSEYENGWYVERPSPENISRLVHVQGPFPTEHDAEQWIKGPKEQS